MYHRSGIAQCKTEFRRLKRAPPVYTLKLDSQTESLIEHMTRILREYVGPPEVMNYFP